MLYHGTHTSLYKTLPLDVIPILEDAIFKTRIRLYDAAEAVFTTELSLYSHIPIVALEHAELSLHRYKFLLILEALDKVPDTTFTDSEEDGQVKQLFAVFRAFAKIQTEATYGPAMDEIKHLQQALAKKSVDDYSDIEVESVRKYALACNNLEYASSFITEDMKSVPTPKPSTTPLPAWRGLTDLRVSLASQGRFMEAIRLSTVERAFSSAIERYQTTCLLLQLATEQRARVLDTKDEIPWSAAILQLKQDIGGLFADLGAKKEAEVWLSSLENDLKVIITKLNGGNGTFKVSDSLDTLTIEYYRLILAGNEEPTEAQFKQLLTLAERMLLVSHIKAETCHDMAVSWAKKLYSGEDCNTICTQIQLRNQHLLEDIQVRIPTAIVNLAMIINPRATKINEAVKSIEMIETFIRRHPQVTLPTVLPSVKKHLEIREVLYAQTGSRPHLVEYLGSEEAREIQSSLPTGWKSQRGVSSIEINAEILKVKHILDGRDVADLDFDMMYRFFLDSQEVRAPKWLRKLLVEESQLGLVTDQAIMTMFGIQESDEKIVIEILMKLSDVELLQKLLGNLESPVRAAEWRKRSPLLRAWLLNTSRPEFAVRQCLWIDLHNIRQQIWSSRCIHNWFQKKFQETHVTTPENREELERANAIGLDEETLENIIAIEDRLRLDEAKLGFYYNHYGKESFLLEGSIPDLCIQRFFCYLVLDREPNATAISALEYGENVARRQLAHWRKEGNYQRIAQSAIVIATIAQYRLESRIIKETAMVNQALKESLSLLEEIESLFGTTLYEADISYSLATLETKVSMGNTMRIWTVGQTAIRLLLHAIQMINNGNDDNVDEVPESAYQKNVLRLWQWVQRVKARSLAQSMGLDNMVPDVMLTGIQNSINDERANAKSALIEQFNQRSQYSEAELAKAFESIKLEEVSAPPLNLLPGVRRILKDGKVIITDGRVTSENPYPPELSSKIIIDAINSIMRDLNLAKSTAEKIKDMATSGDESAETLRETLSAVNARLNSSPALTKLVYIADLLNQEETLVRGIEDDPMKDRFQSRFELQNLRKEMRDEPVLQRMLRIREGWPLSPDDLQKIAADRKGKVSFVDWFRVTSSFNQTDKIYMIVWRNGICKLIDLETDFKKLWQEISAFFDLKNKDIYLPNVDRTQLGKMDWEKILPKQVEIDEDDVRPVESCIELIRPLFDDPLIEPEDLLVLSVTEGLQNFPLHAVDDHEKGPLILHHPVVYIPSLSVLHKCFWSRYTSNETPDTINTKIRSLIVGGVDSKKEAYQYGGKAVERIGTILDSSGTTFTRDRATLSNFTTHISNSELLHIHLHTNYGTNEIKPSPIPLRSGHPTTSASQDLSFAASPLNQAIVFNGPSTSPSPPLSNQLSARQILALKLSRGAHLNLVCCASGQQGKFSINNHQPMFYHITDEVMGLVPAFLFAGAGSVTSTLWPIQDEHGAVFSCLFFRELMRAKKGAGVGGGEKNAGTGTGMSTVTGTDQNRSKGKGKGKGKNKNKNKNGGKGRETEIGNGGTPLDGWADLAEVHRSAVLEMRSIYKQPSAWAGFILSGYWRFKVG